MQTPMPKRIPMPLNYVTNTQNYLNLKNIDKDSYCYITVVSVRYQDIINDLDYFKYFLKNFKNIQSIHCDCYECLIIINDLLENQSEISFSLLDDGKNIDRSYIDLSRLDKINNIILPITYIMWNIDIKDNQPVSCLTDIINNTYLSYCMNGNSTLSKDAVNKIKEIVCYLSKTNNLTDIEKTLIISDFIQSKVQYIDKVDLIKITGLVETVLFKNFGLCMGIANATTLLSNNPIFNLNTRSIYGSDHVWNIQTFDGIDYYIDNTWNITRNPNKFEDMLRAKEFTTKYIMLGRDTALQLGNHEQKTILLRKINLSNVNYSQEELSKVSEVLKQKKLIKLKYYE